jgi:putative glutamine amidotransferase
MSKEVCPIVAIPACAVSLDGRLAHRVAESYVQGVVEGSGCMPLLVPPVGEVTCFEAMIDRLDGLFLTGGASNVEPHHYDGRQSRAGTLHDPARDGTVLPAIRAAIAAGVPILAVCRGIQELNVALGGTLHQNVHELPGKNEHRMNRALPPDERFQVRHPIMIQSGGLFEELTGGAEELMVNSLHAQAIDSLADGLFVEAVSDDGVIEAVSMPDAKGLVLGVQWHAERPHATATPLSEALFRAFGDACRARLAARGDAASSVRAA